MSRMVIVVTVTTVLLACPSRSVMPNEPCEPATQWRLWEAYAARFISDDGRVVDYAAKNHSTSEGQAYGAFFALVANDRARFDQILKWTTVNLAAGDLTKRLPAWRWGKRPNGRWGVLDKNAASDADLWLAYALLEADRLWGEPAYGRLARAILANVVREETVELPGLGPMLLPGPVGFRLDPKTWRLNPSYLPIQLLRRFEAAKIPGAWDRMVTGTVAMAKHLAGSNTWPDWIAWREGKGFIVDPVSGPVGSYDAIRCYLWHGMLPREEPHREVLLDSSRGLPDAYNMHEYVLEKVDTQAREQLLGLPAPIGFSAALVPLTRALGDGDAAGRLEARVATGRRGDLYGDPPVYYDHNLILFAQGFTEGRYRFGATGTLDPAWRRSCGKY